MTHYALFHYSLIYEFVIKCNHIMLDWMRFWVGVLESALERFFLYLLKSSFSVAASGPLPFLLSVVYRRVLFWGHHCFSAYLLLLQFCMMK